MRHLCLLFCTLLLTLSVISGIPNATSAQETQPDLVDMSVADAAQGIKDGQISSVMLVEALIARIERYQYLNAFTLFDAESILEQARAADAAIAAGEELGPLHGVPLIIKDNIDVAGLPTTAATPGLDDHIPMANAPIIDALIEAGAIILGKANMDELALGTTGTVSTFGPVRNPYNPLLFPGGSSSGTAVAVAARLAPGGLGTDTAGSIRMPASLTGIYGFRPSQGRYSQVGIVPLARSRDTAGPMARTVSDIVLLDSVITGDTSPVQPADLVGLRLGVPRGYFYENLSDDTARVTEAALARLEAAGVVLVEADIPNVAALDAAIAIPMTGYEFPQDLTSYLQGTDISILDVLFAVGTPDVQAWLEQGMSGSEITESDYEAAIEQRTILQTVIAEYFAEHELDAIIFPTTPLPARPIAQDPSLIGATTPRIDLDGTLVPTLFYSRNTNIASSADLPGLTIPVGLTPNGLPIGLEIDGLTGSDRDLLAIGLALELIFGDVEAPSLP